MDPLYFWAKHDFVGCQANNFLTSLFPVLKKKYTLTDPSWEDGKKVSFSVTDISGKGDETDVIIFIQKNNLRVEIRSLNSFLKMAVYSYLQKELKKRFEILLPEVA
jgi:hypothetical protein